MVDEIATVRTLRTAVLVLARRLRNQAVPGELSATEVEVLFRLAHRGDLTPGQLARAEHVQPPSMTRVLERLHERGLVDRRAHPGDGRQVLVEITAAGRAVTQDVRETRTAWLHRQFARLEEPERSAIAAAADALARLAALDDTPAASVR
jgi:DNA-binding MarR family transcriptional regulator